LLDGLLLFALLGLLGILLLSELVVVDLFHLEYMSVHDSSHVRIICSLVIMRQQLGAFIVAEAILQVELKLEVVLVLLVSPTLLVDLAQGRLEEMLAVEGEHFRIVGLWEARIPLLGKLDISLGKLTNELVVQVKPVIHAVVADNRHLGSNDGINDQ